MKVLAIVGKFRDKILSGNKTITIRIPGKKKFRKGEKVRLDCGQRILGIARILRVYKKKIKEITEEEIKKDGLSSKEELIKTLEELYERKIDENTLVEIIEFKLEKILDEDFYYFHYKDYDIIEIAKKGLEMKDLNEFEKKILQRIVETGSIRKVAMEFFGSLNKRPIVRRILRKVLKRLERVDRHDK